MFVQAAPYDQGFYPDDLARSFEYRFDKLLLNVETLILTIHYNISICLH